MAEPSVVRSRDKKEESAKKLLENCRFASITILPLLIYASTFVTKSWVTGCGWLLAITASAMAVSWLIGIRILWKAEYSDEAKLSFYILFSMFVAFLCAHRYIDFIVTCVQGDV